jgi:hypothetical protein
VPLTGPIFSVVPVAQVPPLRQTNLPATARTSRPRQRLALQPIYPPSGDQLQIQALEAALRYTHQRRLHRLPKVVSPLREFSRAHQVLLDLLQGY